MDGWWRNDWSECMKTWMKEANEGMDERLTDEWMEGVNAWMRNEWSNWLANERMDGTSEWMMIDESMMDEKFCKPKTNITSNMKLESQYEKLDDDGFIKKDTKRPICLPKS